MARRGIVWHLLGAPTLVYPAALADAERTQLDAVGQSAVVMDLFAASTAIFCRILSVAERRCVSHAVLGTAQALSSGTGQA